MNDSKLYQTDKTIFTQIEPILWADLIIIFGFIVFYIKNKKMQKKIMSNLFLSY